MKPAFRRGAWAAGLATAAAILVWRIQAPTWHPFYLDMLFIVVLHGVYSAFGRDRREWPVVTVATSLFLLAIFLKGQLPHTLWVLDLLP